MNKKVFIIIPAMLLLMLVSVLAADCNPTSPFTSCYIENYQLGCVNPTAKLQSGLMWSYNLADGKYIDVTKPLDIRCDGDYLYLYDLNKKTLTQVDNSCGSGGCNGYITTLPTNTNIQVQLNNYAPIKPMFVCFDYQSKTCQSGYSPTWAWITSGSYWTDSFKKSAIECSTDATCGSSQYCKKESSTKTTCTQLVCDSSAEIVNHQCISKNLPKMCTDAKISNVYECQNYVTQYISIISGDINAKVAQISNLQLTVDQYAKVISDLTSVREQQAVLITKLNLSIQQDAQIIVKLTQTQAEQAEIILALNLSIQKQAELITALQLKVTEQATLINQLTSNLALKAAYVNALTVENDKQAALIREMRLSFANQGAIIDNLNLTIQDDAQIIVKLTTNVQEQAQIVNELSINNAQMKQLITELQVKNSDMAKFVAELQSNLHDRDLLISQYNVTIQDYQSALANQQEEKNTLATVAIIVIITLVLALLFVAFKNKKRR